MIKIFSIETEKDNLVFKFQNAITVCLSLKEIYEKNTENGLLCISGCVEDSFEKILNHKNMDFANGIFKEIFQNDREEVCEKLSEIFMNYSD